MPDQLETNVSESRDVEPTALRDPVPVWMIVLTLVLFFLGCFYFDSHGAWFNGQVYGPYTSAKQLAMYQPQSGAASFLALGRSTYENVCGVCHGSDGLGKPNQAPPLAGSEWVNKDVATFAHIPLVGLNGPVQVKGQTWNLSMAPMGAALSNDKLAAVLSYIRNSWGNRGETITADEIKAVRKDLRGNSPSPAAWAKMTPVERGHAIYQKFNCAQCHGPNGKGGVSNPNAKTAEQVPALIHVADGYSKSELIAFIKKGEKNIPRLNPNGPAPPRFMPAWHGIISSNELVNLADYLFSLKPKEDDLGF